LFGQERNLNTWAIAQMNLFLHDIDDASVARGDTLLDPKHLTGDGTKVIRTFDRVLANPPFSLKNWGYENWSNGDPFGRDRFGCPPKSYGDFAFVQHMIASLKEDGMLGVVLPHGVLFRGGAEGRIREGMLKEDLIEAVIGLASNLFYGAGIPACILIIRKNKPAARKGKVLFINGVEHFIESKAQNQLSDQNVATLADAFHGYAEVERLARAVPLTEIVANDYNLNISRYVHLTEEAEDLDVSEEIEKLLELREQRDAAEAKMIGFLKELGYVS
jgi:type I restriction enzyme M protein